MLVIKRDGSSVDFDIKKIENAIDKAFVAVDRKPLEFVTQRLALLAISKLDSKAEEWKIEDIQDSVEYALVEAGFSDVAKAYILYRQSRSDRRAGKTVIDYKKIIENYVDAVDWRVKENSTVNYSIGGLILNASGAVTANYWLSEVYDKEIGEAHKNGDMHIHDLSMLAPYCFTGDTVVRSLDGKNRTFEQLVKDGVKELWVYAYDHKNNCIVPAKAINPRVTRKTNKLVRVKFTGGVEFTCTPDHPIMLRNGEYIKAEDIKPNMSVMPLYVSEKSKYCRINKNWVVDDRQQYVHRWVLENKLGRALGDDEVAHHLNGDKHDNRPENLDVMMDKEHRAMEVRRTMETDNWKRNNNARLVSYNRSPEKRAQVSAFAKDRPRTVAGTFAYMGRPYGVAYNHCVRSVKKIELEKAVKVYDLTVPGYENFAVAGGVFVHNCAGWSLKQLIREGLGGVPGKIASKPATHLSTLCNQMVNFLGIMQNEWAGAQAFSSFDTYLAAFVKKDNLTYKQVKQCIQSFIFGVNTPSRWGCLKDSTQVMTPSGWKYNHELKIGDEIYTWVDGTLHTAKLNNIIRRKNDFGVMHRYKGESYVQTVTPEHRCIVEMGTGRGVYGIKQSMDIFTNRADLRMPSCIQDVDVPYDSDLSDDEVRLAAMYYTDGSRDFSDMRICKSERRHPEIIEQLLDDMGIEYTVYKQTMPEGRYTLKNFHISGKHRKYMENLIGDKYAINPKFLHLDKRQSELFIRTWAQFDGCTTGDRISCQYDNNGIRDALEIIFARAGYISHIWSRKKATDAKATNYVYAERKLSTVITEREEIPYNGIVWCPNTDDGTAIYRDEDGFIFISGNCQAPFSNITLDWNIPEDLKDVPAIVGGKDMDFTYGDCQKEADMVNKAFIEVMTEGDANGRGFQYPIPTYSITKDFNWSEIENNKALFEMAAKYGTPYFSNYVNSDMQPSDVRSMCCRLRLDLRDLRRKNGGFFGSGDSTGSVGVVTINMPRIGYLSTSKEDFFEKLDHMMDIAARSLKLKRNKINELLEKGLYPYTKRYLGTLANHFSTIGLVGMNEACLNAKWLGKNMTDPEAQKFAEDVLDHMRERLADYQEMYPGDLYNLEATPAESTAFRLAKHDLERFPDIITSGTPESPYYTNSTNLPVGYTDDIWKALDVQDRLQPKYTSGTVFHTFLGQRISDWRGAMNLIRAICSNYRLPYISLSPTYSVCQEHGYLEGEQAICPHCGRTTEIYSRITGYYRAVQNWNPGKVQEYKERKEYDPEGNPSEVGNKDSGCESCDISDNGMTCEKQHDPEEVVAQAGEKFSKPMLFTTPTCPNCPTAKAHLTRKGIEYDVIDATQAIELVERYGIQSVPTLVADGEVYRGLGAVMGWINKH